MDCSDVTSRNRRDPGSDPFYVICQGAAARLIDAFHRAAPDASGSFGMFESLVPCNYMQRFTPTSMAPEPWVSVQKVCLVRVTLPGMQWEKRLRWLLLTY
jgi:hypothetical protein